MGTLRTLFSIAVVLAHSTGDLLVGGRNAVQLFYMISGFLISYILVERKAYPNIKDFYINRYLRLYPIYFVVAIFTFIVFIFASAVGKDIVFFSVYKNAPLIADIFLVFSNLTLFLQDWILFVGVEQNQLVFLAKSVQSKIVLSRGLLVPQAWTLGVELTFYVLAPLILPRKKILISFLATSLLVRIWMISTGLGVQDPWTYRFFPNELALFLFGALSHQILLPLYKEKFQKSQIEKNSKLATYFLIFITFLFSFIPISDTQKSLGLFVVFFFLLPFTFIFQTHRKVDKWIGDLSYPIYICHMLVIYILNFVISKLAIAQKINFMGKIVELDRIALAFSAVFLSILLAILLNKYVGKPIETIRNKFRCEK